MDRMRDIDPDRPVLIAGPTASGKSALAIEIACAQGRVIVNADALQVWSCWHILSARPTRADLACAPHRLFGHKEAGADYSVGHWLREVAEILADDPRPVIVGGTGLYLTALTEGLAVIPAIPPGVRAEANRLMAVAGPEAMLSALDPATRARIDEKNPARIQRAWEVQTSTGRGLAEWQANTGAGLLPEGAATRIWLDCDRDWLAHRIDTRFDAIIGGGALDEVAAILPQWDPQSPWAKAIGAPELVAYLQGVMTLPDAISAAKAASRQYAKRQRTWLRRRMHGWTALPRP